MTKNWWFLQHLNRAVEGRENRVSIENRVKLTVRNNWKDSRRSLRYNSRFPLSSLYVISCNLSRRILLHDAGYFYLRRSISISAWASAWSCPSVWISPRCKSRRGSRIAARNGRSSWHRGWKSRNGRDFSHRRTFRQPSILYCRITRRLWCSEVRCRMTRTLVCRLDPLYRPQIRSDAAQTRTTWSIVG